MGGFYINFYFSDLEYSDDFFSGSFSAPDNDIFCSFHYDRIAGKTEIWNNNKSIEEILPLPVWWLEKKIRQNGKLNDHEQKISY